MAEDSKKLLERYQPKEIKVLPQDVQLSIVRFSPCGKILAAGGFDGSVRRFDATADALPALPPLTGHNGWVQTLAFHSDGQWLFTADSWGQLRCWPYAEKQPAPRWKLEAAHAGSIRGVAVSPDGKLVASCGSDRIVRLWSTEDGRKQQELSGHGEDVFSLAFHPDGKALVSGDLKGVVKQWDLASGKSVREFDAHALYFFERLQDVGGVRRLAFNRAGTLLACAGSQPSGGGFVQGLPLILLFDWTSGKLLHTLAGEKENDGFTHDVHLHPDGFVMAVTSGQPGSGQLFFRQPAEAKPFFVTTKMPNCHSLAIHPNGKRLVVAATNAGSNGNGRVLDKRKNEYVGNWSPLHVWDMP